MNLSKKEIFEKLKEKKGFKILAILSNLSNYHYFLECNYNELHKHFQRIQSWTQLRDNQNKISVQFYQIYLDLSHHLLNYSTTAKALGEKSMGWRNHLKKHLSCDLYSEYEQKLTEYDVQTHGDYFNKLRNNFLHKRNEEATSQYTIKFKFTRKDKDSVKILSKEIGQDLLPASTDYYEAQTRFTKWFIQEIIKQFAKELQEVQSIIITDKLAIILHPDVLELLQKKI